MPGTTVERLDSAINFDGEQGPLTNKFFPSSSARVEMEEMEGGYLPVGR